MAGQTIIRYGLTFAPPGEWTCWTGQFETLDEALAKALELAPAASFKKVHQLDATDLSRIPNDQLYSDFWYIIRDGVFVGLIGPEPHKTQIDYHGCHQRNQTVQRRCSPNRLAVKEWRE